MVNTWDNVNQIFHGESGSGGEVVFSHGGRSMLVRDYGESYLINSISRGDSRDLLRPGATDYIKFPDESVVANMLLKDESPFSLMCGYTISADNHLHTPTRSVFRQLGNGESYLVKRVSMNEGCVMEGIRYLGCMELPIWVDACMADSSTTLGYTSEAYYWLQFDGDNRYSIFSSSELVTRKNPFPVMNKLSLNFSDEKGNIHPNFINLLVTVFPNLFLHGSGDVLEFMGGGTLQDSRRELEEILLIPRKEIFAYWDMFKDKFG